jgi:hypothetical protein
MIAISEDAQLSFKNCIELGTLAGAGLMSPPTPGQVTPTSQEGVLLPGSAPVVCG